LKAYLDAYMEAAGRRDGGWKMQSRMFSTSP
jgi:hypothetical protein